MSKLFLIKRFLSPKACEGTSELGAKPKEYLEKGHSSLLGRQQFLCYENQVTWQLTMAIKILVGDKPSKSNRFLNEANQILMKIVSYWFQEETWMFIQLCQREKGIHTVLEINCAMFFLCLVNVLFY